MDSRELPPSFMMGPTSYASHPSMNPNSTILAPTTARFPFASHSQVPPLSSSSVIPSEPFNAAAAATTTSPYDGSSNSSALNPCGPAKKKRGRPRKYSPDGDIALGFVPTTHMPSSAGHGGARGGGVGGDSSGTPSTEAPAKKHRGRPRGSGKKQLDAFGAGGVGFKHHVIFVESGEDIAEKVVACSQQGSRTICILSASGLVSNVTLRQTALSGGTATYEGQFEIISLSSFLPQSGNNAERSRTSSLNVILAGSDGRVLGGGVVGMLTAASLVQIVVGSFIANGKKSSSNILKSGPSSAPTSQMLTFGGSMTPTSPTSQGPSSESSEDNDHSSFRGPGLYNNDSQPINNNIQMYHHPLWAGHNHQ